MSEKTESAPVPAPSSKGRTSYILAVVFAVAVTVWVASGLIGGADQPDEAPAVENDTTSAPEAVSVRVQLMHAQDRPQKILVTGRTDALDDIKIVAETAGQVIARPLRQGVSVEKGDLILQLATNDRASRLEEAKSLVASAQINFDAATDLQRKQFESQVRLAESRAELASAKALLAAVELDIARTRIRAPSSGYLQAVLADPGDYVVAEQEVAHIVQLDPIRVLVNVTERDIADVSIDDLVTVRLPDGAEVGGTVQFVSKVANEATRTFRVDVWIDNPENKIPVGVTAQVGLMAGDRKAHKIATSALTLNDQGELGIRAVDGANTVVFHRVKLVEDTPTGIWVTGLPETVRIITVGQEFVVEGQTVNPSDGSGAS